MMAKQTTLYNHHRKPVGTAVFNKKNATINVNYNESIHYANTTIDFDEYDDYKRRLDLKDENELGQLELF